MSGKLINPIYTWLSESVLTDKLIASQKGDNISWALALTCDFLYSSANLENDLKVLTSKIESFDYKIKDIVAMSVAVFLSEKLHISLPPNFVNSTNRIISNLGTQKIPSQHKVETYYFARQTSSLVCDALKTSIYEMRRQAIEQRDYNDLIEFEHALGKESYSANIWSALENVEGLDVSKRAKLGLLEVEAGIDESNIAKVEKKTWERINDASLPTMSLLVYEAEKLISTNLDLTKLNEVLSTLQKGNTSWARLITKIRDSGVTVDISGLNRAPSLSINESVWSLLLLDKKGRKETYQISQEEMDSLNEYNQMLKTDTNLIPEKAIFTFNSFALLVIFLMYLYFDIYGRGKIIEGFTNFTTLGNTRLFPETVGDLWSPVVVLILGVKYIWYSWMHLKTKHTFDLHAAVKSLIAIRPKG